MPSTREFSLLILILAASYCAAATKTVNFTYHGFKDANLTLFGVAEILPDGLLRLTKDSQVAIGHAFYPVPLALSPAISFSSVFVVAIVANPKFGDHFGHGITFALVPSLKLPTSWNGQTLGLINISDSATPISSGTNASSLSSPRVVAVELDTVKNPELKDIDNSHIGINVNNMESIAAAPAAYYVSATSFVNFSLFDGQPVWGWVDYDGSQKRMNVTVARKGAPLPEIQLLANVYVDVAAVTSAESFVGFTTTIASATEAHYVLGWSFATGGSAAPELDPSRLPKVPKQQRQ